MLYSAMSSRSKWSANMDDPKPKDKKSFAEKVSDTAKELSGEVADATTGAMKTVVHAFLNPPPPPEVPEIHIPEVSTRAPSSGRKKRAPKRASSKKKRTKAARRANKPVARKTAAGKSSRKKTTTKASRKSATKRSKSRKR
jgi:hypothetical protein